MHLAKTCECVHQIAMFGDLPYLANSVISLAFCLKRSYS